MSENNDFGFDMKAEAPTLTLEPDLSAPIVSEEKDIQTTETAKAELAQKEQLSPEELKMVDDFAQKIDITNSQMILQYGAGTQKKVAEFSEKALETVKTKDIGEVGNMLASVVTELRTMDDSGKDSKGFLGFFKKKTNELAAYKARYEKAEVNIDRIASELEKHQVILLKDISMLDKMYEVNLAHFKELTLYIAAGKKKLEEARRVDLAKLTEKAKQTGLQEDMCNRFEKKIYDLELSKAVALQTAPQIRLIQSNDTVMTEKIQSTLVNTIPLWKSQMVIAIGLNHSQQAAKAQAAVSNATNEMLKKNAELLHTATIETAKESERGIIDIETLKSTNQTLISTLDEVLKIQEDGREKRKNAEIELQNIENTMRAKLLDMSKQQANINRQ